ncbi:MAG: hypothetical protein QXK37_04130 [Candidatus Woesearchaeota archaeon]
MKRSIYHISECPDCASQSIIHSEKSSQIICRDCGLIFDPNNPAMEVRFSVPSNTKKEIIKVHAIEQKKPVKKRPKRSEKKKKALVKAKKKTATKRTIAQKAIRTTKKFLKKFSLKKKKR